MENQYRIPKQRIGADITFAGAAPMRLSLYLNERAETHAGYERPSDLLNGAAMFVPATQTDGGVVILNRDLVRTVEVDARYEFGAESRNGADGDPTASYVLTTAEIRVGLSDGSIISGTIAFSLPGSQRRVQDFMNLDDQFLVMRRENAAVLVNKAQIVKVSIV